jgi:hypothetical protein
MSRLLTQRTGILALIAAALLWATPIHAQQGPLAQAAFAKALSVTKPALFPKEADKLHVVLLVFGHKGGISAACQKDCKAFLASLESTFEDDDEDRLVVHDLSIKNPKTGKVFTAAETLAVINRMRVGRNDNVVVFQSGHGDIMNRDNPEMSHRLMMDGGSLTRAQIQNPIMAMKPRAFLFITDCCSGFSSKKKSAAPSPTDFVTVAEPNRATIRNLMMRPIGLVSVTAAEDGKLASASYSGANPAKAGSAFTVAMLRLWYKDTTYNSWNDFFPPLKAETRLASRGGHMARAFHLNDGMMPSVIVMPPYLGMPMWQIAQ